MNGAMLMVAYALPLGLIVRAYAGWRTAQHATSVSALREARETGLTEPASLHPVIDPTKCVGCAACVAACPEMPGHRVLGLIQGKAELVGPADCIGHGACERACPVGAISLVFGTAKRGVDIPVVKPNFETTVPGVFVAGELGGMGLIRNAIEQGRQAIAGIRRHPGIGCGDMLDVVIVGAGPAGFAASLAAKAAGLRFATIEQERLGGTVAHFPRRKLVMTQPAELPLVGKVRFRETTKEALLDFWTRVERDTGLQINYQERVVEVHRHDDGFEVTTTARRYRTRTVLLAIGRRGTPRRLGVAGEDLSKVTYRLLDPEQYRGQRVLVVGGGDSALEAACSIAELPDTRVALAYRGEAFQRAKAKNRKRLESAAAVGRLSLLLRTELLAIEAGRVRVRTAEQELGLPNDAVIINAGGILPTAFLQSIGIAVETKYGTA